MNDREFRRHCRRLLLAWIALLALMSASLASAYVPLGWANGAIGVAIAATKSAIVLALFMGLARAPALLRVVAGLALVTWLIQLSLGGVDYATRRHEPAAVQMPEQVPALVKR